MPRYRAGHRGIGSGQPHDTSASLTTLTNAAHSGVSAERLSDAVASLSDCSQALLSLRFAQGLSLQEAGRILQRTQEDLLLEQLRAIRALRDRLTATG